VFTGARRAGKEEEAAKMAKTGLGMQENYVTK
jgi:hypothetical protein